MEIVEKKGLVAYGWHRLENRIGRWSMMHVVILWPRDTKNRYRTSTESMCDAHLVIFWPRATTPAVGLKSHDDDDCVSGTAVPRWGGTHGRIRLTRWSRWGSDDDAVRASLQSSPYIGVVWCTSACTGVFFVSLAHMSNVAESQADDDPESLNCSAVRSSPDVDDLSRDHCCTKTWKSSASECTSICFVALSVPSGESLRKTSGEESSRRCIFDSLHCHFCIIFVGRGATTTTCVGERRVWNCP